MEWGFKWIISRNKYRFEITTQLKNSNFDYIIDPTFKNINRLSVQSFKVGENDPIRNYFVRYYMSVVEVKNFKVMIIIMIIFW